MVWIRAPPGEMDAGPSLALLWVICSVACALAVTQLHAHPLALGMATCHSLGPAPPMDAPCLVLCTHDFEHIDLLAVIRESRGWPGQTALIVADRWYNRVWPLLGANTIPTGGGTVGRAVRALSERNVCIFLYRDTRGTGAYRIMQAHRGPVLQLQVRRVLRPGADLCEGHRPGQCVAVTAGQVFTCRYRDATRSVRALLREDRAPDSAMSQILRELYRECDAPLPLKGNV